MPRQSRKLPFAQRLNNPYTIVGRCLAPALPPDDKQELSDALKGNLVSWGALLLTANMNRCTPLWYVRLCDHGLIEIVPHDLREYLTQLHAANCERNQKIRSELIKIISLFNQEKIPVLLLKGAITFADNLYSDIGARMMNDLDLLVPEVDVFRAKNLLMSKGYIENQKDELEVQNGKILSRGKHLTSIKKPGSPAKIELHYRVMHGIAGRILTTENTWETKNKVKLNNCIALLPAPTIRLLHTMIHATQTGKAFLRSHVNLSDLAEFAAVTNNQYDNIDTQHFWNVAGQRQVKTEAIVFTGLVRTVFLAKFQAPPNRLSQFHMARVINNSQPMNINSVTELTSQEASPHHFNGNHDTEKQRKPFAAAFWRLAQLIHYYISMPKWLWWSIAFASENARKMGLLKFILKNIMKKNKWELITFGK